MRDILHIRAYVRAPEKYLYQWYQLLRILCIRKKTSTAHKIVANKRRAIYKQTGTRTIIFTRCYAVYGTGRRILSIYSNVFFAASLFLSRLSRHTLASRGTVLFHFGSASSLFICYFFFVLISAIAGNNCSPSPGKRRIYNSRVAGLFVLSSLQRQPALALF